ncbi:hypothetical protein BDP27DRAFT_483516 [Rhodocollybia butyracea]|uniref:Uncharacterized protein n=1 Tax=Rhodocollybia butyracea TaxID=206335 RepID=A0A9P5UEU8_9AGAR|nr:hypothetical protein BDP27DRAFT_483516 [Rhodocollybia butyracea]
MFIQIQSPTPPGSTRNGNEDLRRSPYNEFLSAKDAERPTPMPGTPRDQSSSPRLHPVGLVDPPLPTAPFGSPSIGTPITLGNAGIFVPSSFQPSPGPGIPSSPHPTTSPLPSEVPLPGYSYNGMTNNSRPVIPDPNLLGPADSDSDSDDRVSSGMNSENTLTTPPTVARGLPQNNRGGAKTRAAGKKKRR